MTQTHRRFSAGGASSGRSSPTGRDFGAAVFTGAPVGSTSTVSSGRAVLTCGEDRAVSSGRPAGTGGSGRAGSRDSSRIGSVSAVSAFILTSLRAVSFGRTTRKLRYNAGPRGFGGSQGPPLAAGESYHPGDRAFLAASPCAPRRTARAGVPSEDGPRARRAPGRSKIRAAASELIDPAGRFGGRRFDGASLRGVRDPIAGRLGTLRRPRSSRLARKRGRPRSGFRRRSRAAPRDSFSDPKM